MEKKKCTVESESKRDSSGSSGKNQWGDFEGTEKEQTKIIKKSYHRILSLIKKELGLVKKNHYRTLWMSLGMSIFGVPIGAGISVVLDNFAMIGAFIPIGMGIGMALGTGMDSKAAKEGKQLDL